MAALGSRPEQGNRGQPLPVPGDDRSEKPVQARRVPDLFAEYQPAPFLRAHQVRVSGRDTDFYQMHARQEEVLVHVLRHRRKENRIDAEAFLHVRAMDFAVAQDRARTPGNLAQQVEDARGRTGIERDLVDFADLGFQVRNWRRVVTDDHAMQPFPEVARGRPRAKRDALQHMIPRIWPENRVGMHCGPGCTLHIPHPGEAGVFFPWQAASNSTAR
ncbi:hypothetical protein [Mangrovicoccus sp. HB161399]|uniref:hypothetical protein n=1 Tax=Mangrovicoccus sp. HB161399 TaxID=2720392 RepID=UPI001556DBC2|nr:hypothetical protein [Mangrovicoccus sp. HB161399]